MSTKSNLNGKQWVQMPQTLAHDIAFGANGNMYAVGSTFGNNGNLVWSKTNYMDVWHPTPFEGCDISVEPDGTPWMTRGGAARDEGGPIYRGNTLIPGGAFDIGIGSMGHIFVTGTKEPQSGHRVWPFINGVFQGALNIIGEHAGRIAVDPNGKPWVVAMSGNIYRFESGTWTKLPGQARDIGIGADGSVWIVGTQYSSIWQWSESDYTWHSFSSPDNTADFWRIAVSPEGIPFAVHSPARLATESSIPTTDKYPNGTVFYLK